MSTLTKNCHSCYEAVPELANKCTLFEDLRADQRRFKSANDPLAFLAITFTGYLGRLYHTSQAFNKHVFDHETKALCKFQKRRRHHFLKSHLRTFQVLNM